MNVLKAVLLSGIVICQWAHAMNGISGNTLLQQYQIVIGCEQFMRLQDYGIEQLFNQHRNSLICIPDMYFQSVQRSVPQFLLALNSKPISPSEKSMLLLSYLEREISYPLKRFTIETRRITGKEDIDPQYQDARERYLKSMNLRYKAIKKLVIDHFVNPLVFQSSINALITACTKLADIEIIGRTAQ